MFVVDYLFTHNKTECVCFQSNNNNSLNPQSSTMRTPNSRIAVVLVVILIVLPFSMGKCISDNDCTIGSIGKGCLTSVCDTSTGACTAMAQKNCTLSRCAERLVNHECKHECHERCEEECKLSIAIERAWYHPVPLPLPGSCVECWTSEVVGSSCGECIERNLQLCVRDGPCHSDECTAGTCKSVKSVFGAGVGCHVNDDGIPVADREMDNPEKRGFVQIEPNTNDDTTKRSTNDDGVGVPLFLQQNYRHDDHHDDPHDEQPPPLCTNYAYIDGLVVLRPIKCHSTNPCVVGECNTTTGACGFSTVDCEGACPGTRCISRDDRYRCVGRRTECAEYVCDMFLKTEVISPMHEGVPCDDGAGRCVRGACIRTDRHHHEIIYTDHDRDHHDNDNDHHSTSEHDHHDDSFVEPATGKTTKIRLLLGGCFFVIVVFGAIVAAFIFCRKPAPHHKVHSTKKQKSKKHKGSKHTKKTRTDNELWE